MVLGAPCIGANVVQCSRCISGRLRDGFPRLALF
jgi:hypothetical protein